MGAGHDTPQVRTERRHHRQPVGNDHRGGWSRGDYTGKTINGRKRHTVTVTLRRLMGGVVHGADVQDRGSDPGLIEWSCGAYPAPTRLFADGDYTCQKLKAAVGHIDQLTIEIIRRSDVTGFVVLPPC